MRAIDSHWFICDPPTANPSLSLVCLPHAGGDASAFRNWRSRLPDDVAVLAVRYPGHQGSLSRPPCTTFYDLVASLTDALVRSVKRDVVLFGHSFGALVAFEVARALHQTGQIRLRHLFVSGSRPPHLGPCGPIVHAWPDSSLLEYIVALGGIPPEVLREHTLIDMWLPIVRADLQMDETYSYIPSAPLDFPITAFAGEYDHAASVECVAGWSQHTQRAFRLFPLSTGHFWTPECTSSALRILGRILAGLNQGEG